MSDKSFLLKAQPDRCLLLHGFQMERGVMGPLMAWEKLLYRSAPSVEVAEVSFQVRWMQTKVAYLAAQGFYVA